jgi:bifunctional DNA-binding transcriptional regulator/antitoxin component of YhaV-PrlF toxin-antitoxin module
MTGLVQPLSLPPRIGVPAANRAPAGGLAPLPMPSLPDLTTGGERRFSTALLDTSGRIQDRGIVTALGWKPGDRLLITQIRSSAVICRRGDGIFRMTSKPYVVLPAPVRHGCGVLVGSRVLLVADLEQDVLVVHPEHVVHAMLRDFHTMLAAREADE